MKKFRLDGIVGVAFDAAYVASQLSGADDVEITLNTKGGHIHEGLQIYAALADHKGFVTIIVDQAMSMGSIIMLAADKRVARRESSVIMIHRPSGMGGGRSEDLRAGADELDRLQAKMEDIYMMHYSATRSELVSMLDGETFMDADEAKSLGLVDEVISGSKNALHQMAFAALADDSTGFDRTKFAAKVKQIEAKAGDFCGNLKKAVKLSEIEATLRTRGLSRTEATAIVGSVKRVQGDLVGMASEDSEAKVLELLNDFKL